MKMESFCSSKDIINKVKKKPREKIFANQLFKYSDNELISRIYRECIKLNNSNNNKNKQTIRFKNGQRTK